MKYDASDLPFIRIDKVYIKLFLRFTMNRFSRNILCLWCSSYQNYAHVCLMKFLVVDHCSIEHDEVIKCKYFPRYWSFVRGNSPVTGEFPTQRPVTRSFDVFFDLCLNQRLSKQSWGWWFETPSCSLWRHCNEPCPSNSGGRKWKGILTTRARNRICPEQRKIAKKLNFAINE